jgi:peptide/nickel transport system permease protein
MRDGVCNMLRYIAKRLLFMAPLLLGITVICFTVMHLAPGSPTDLQTQMNPRASLEMKERLRAMYDLDKPIHEQYFKWVARLAVLDMGISFSTDRRPVADKILERLPITILLNILSMLLILVVAIPLGVISAVRQDSLFDRITGVVVFIGFAVPTFWLALLLMIISFCRCRCLLLADWPDCRGICGRICWRLFARITS